VVIGIGVFRRACKPEANLEASAYWASILEIIGVIAPAQWSETKDEQPTDAMFRPATVLPFTTKLCLATPFGFK
jgi:hypothetical protein